MKKQSLLLFLVGILLFSACEAPIKTTSSKENFEASVSENSSLINSSTSNSTSTSSNRRFEVGPIDMDSVEYMLPAEIDRKDSLVTVYNRDNIANSPIFLDWYIEADNEKYNIDNVIRIFSFKDEFIWADIFSAEMYAGVMNSNNQHFSNYLYVFTNDQIGTISMTSSEGIRVYDANGDLAIVLNYDFGRDGIELDSDFKKNHYTGITWENVPIGISYLENRNEYVVLYTKNAYFPNMENEQDSENTFRMKVHVALFNTKGEQTEDFPLEDFYYQYISKGSYIPLSYVFSRENNILLLQTGYQDFTIVDIENKTAKINLQISDLLKESPKILVGPNDMYKLEQDPCPVLLTRLETGEITIASKENPAVILETISSHYDPAFYSFNSDGSCNIVFTLWEREKF